ncbi:MAG: hypothetical protein UH080_05935 [Ruminococcus sp.]|nr:hypothetical protein [Ruminococcus sp.]
MKKLRKALASILSLSMIASLAITSPVSVQAANQADVSQLSSQTQNKAADISSVEMQGTVAKVRFKTDIDARLIVAIYDTQGIEMYAYGTTMVKAGETFAQINIDIHRVPDYCYIRAFIIDEKTLRPLCAEYEEYLTNEVEERVKQASFSDSHSAFLSQTGNLYMWGANQYSQLGLGTDYRFGYASPTKLMENVKQVSLGLSHSSAITVDGDLYMWGTGGAGQLGNGEKYEYAIPIKIMSNIKDVSLGNIRSAAITEDGDLYIWGYDGGGRVNGDISCNLTPVKIMSNVKDVELCSDHCAVITEDNDLYMWGDNSSGQLGNNTFISSEKPELIMSGVKSVALGEKHSAAITENGDLYIWGNNGSGRLGDGTMVNKEYPVKIMENVKDVSLGGYFSAAVTENGDLYTWGYNAYGQLGDGTTNLSKIPVKIMSSVKEVELGRSYASAITENGDFYVWGQNRFTLGIEGDKNQYSPVKLTIQSSPLDPYKYYMETKEFKGLGSYQKYNLYIMKSQQAEDLFAPDNLLCVTQLETDDIGTAIVKYKPDKENKNVVFVLKREMFNKGIDAVTVKDNEASVLLSSLCDGELIVAIYDVNGVEMIASGRTTISGYADKANVTIDVEKMPQYFYLRAFLVDSESKIPLCKVYESIEYTKVHYKVEKVGVGFDHTAAITEDGDLYMWGNNQYGQLGCEYPKQTATPIKVMSGVRDVELGKYYSAAITQNNDLYLWGYCEKGGLGDGTSQMSAAPIKILSDVKSVSIGNSHSAAIMQNGDLYMWGFNSRGQIGNGEVSDEYNSVPKPIKVMSGVVKVSVGGLHTAAITEKQELYLWGDNTYGQLGIGSSFSYKEEPVKVMEKIKDVSLGDYTSGAIEKTRYGTLYLWGDNRHDMIKDHPKTIAYQKTDCYYEPYEIIGCSPSLISIGSNHCLVREYLDQVKSKGNNEYGQLGVGNFKNIGYFYSVNGLNNIDIKMICAGGNQSAFVDTSGQLYMCGSNEYSQLESAKWERVNTPVKVYVYSSLYNAEKTENYTTKEFTELTPNKAYNFYMVKSRDAENLLDSENLLYITQAVSDKNGNLSVDYKLSEDSENAVCFVVPADFSEFVFGDINNDTVADVKDVTTLQMYLANYDVAVNENALDVNSNTIVDVTDVTTLQMLLAGYEI